MGLLKLQPYLLYKDQAHANHGISICISALSNPGGYVKSYLNNPHPTVKLLDITQVFLLLSDFWKDKGTDLAIAIVGGLILLAITAGLGVLGRRYCRCKQ